MADVVSVLGGGERKAYSGSATALSESYSPVGGAGFYLREVSLKLDVACTEVENFTITKDAVDGADWDSEVFSQPMSGKISSYVRFEGKGIPFSPGDKVLIAFDNTDNNNYNVLLTVSE